MSDPVTRRMTSDAFIAWAVEQPEGHRYELSGGAVIAMAPERAAHVRAKLWLIRKMADAVERAGSGCEVFTDGMTVVVDDHTAYAPDASIRCGRSVPGDATRISDPIVVVEVLSPSTGYRDMSEKLENDVRIPTVQHTLIVKPETGAIIHHQRQADDTLRTRITHSGPIHLDPPNITLTDPHPRPEA